MTFCFWTVFKLGQIHAATKKPSKAKRKKLNLNGSVNHGNSCLFNKHAYMKVSNKINVL